MPRKLVELIHVYAGYGSEVVLKNVNLDIFENDFIGVIGPNGGGKTTLVKVITGLLKPQKGTVKTYLGEGGSVQPIGYLPQGSFTDKNFPISVGEVVLSGLTTKKSLTGRYSGNDLTLAVEVMEKMGISHLKKKAVGEISGGQRQRVMLARAIISNPGLLILDEPNTYVDNKFEGELYELLRVLNREMAIIIVSHDLGTISTYIKSIACVNVDMHYHKSNIISEEQLAAYNCPIKLITHGDVPHTVLKKHEKHDHQ
ncbi:MAG: ABC transporter ATP-binding protein [Bacteroidales bacterium]|nr:ABC transporter ATP-binding protein [Bacteroidales bacterium]